MVFTPRLSDRPVARGRMRIILTIVALFIIASILQFTPLALFPPAKSDTIYGITAGSTILALFLLIRDRWVNRVSR